MLHQLKVLLRLICCFFFMVLFSVGATGQSVQEELPQPVDNDQFIEGWRAQLDQISSAIKRDGVSDQELLGFRADVTAIKDAANDLIGTLTPEIRSLTTRVNRLEQAAGASSGATPVEEEAANSEEASESQAADAEQSAEPTPAPTTDVESDAEAPLPVSEAERALSREKADLTARIQQLNAQLGRTQVIVLRSDELLADISEARRTRFTNELFRAAPSLISPAVWIGAISETPSLTTGFISILQAGLTRVWQEAPTLFIGVLALGILLSYLLLFHFRPLKLTKMVQATDGTAEEIAENYGPAFNALRRVIRSFILIVLTPGLVLFAITQAGAVADRLSDLLWTLFASIAYFAFARGLSLAIYSPRNETLRLSAADTSRAKRVHGTIMSCLTVSLIGFTLYSFGQILVASENFIVLTLGLTSFIFGFLALSAYALRGRLNEAEEGFVPNILVLRILGVI
ncbi:MAG: DUF3772 domain-containing protein, partial [Pseudomonadota bacterium]